MRKSQYCLQVSMVLFPCAPDVSVSEISTRYSEFLRRLERFMSSTNCEEIGSGSDEDVAENYQLSERRSYYNLNATSVNRDSKDYAAANSGRSYDDGADRGCRFRAFMNIDPPPDATEGSDRDAAAACLEGLVRTDGHGRRLVLLDGNAVYWRGHRSSVVGHRHRVKVLAGNRGGHYPAFARYVGAGMLDAAIAGPTRGRQPSATRVLTAIRELDDGRGVLVLVAGELSARLSYGIAATKARSLGINVKLLAVGDDVVVRCRATAGGHCCRRRGAAGLVLVCKIAGAMSAGGHNLTEIFDACQRLSVVRMATVNAVICRSLLRPTHTGNDRTAEEGDFRNVTNETRDDENDVVLLGTDTNGRDAIRKLWTTDTAEMVSAVLKVLSAYGGDDDLHRWRDADVVVMVNNLGGMSDAQFMAIVAEVAARMTAVTGVRAVHRWYAGRMLSSVGVRDDGFSVTVMDVAAKADGPARSTSLLAHLDLPVAASGWTFSGPGEADASEWPADYVRRPRYDASPLSEDENDDEDEERGDPTKPKVQEPFVKDVLNHVCDRIVEAEGRLNALDATDDGDCGSNWARGAAALKEAVVAGRMNAARPEDTLRAVSQLMETRVAGTSGMLLAVLFRSWSRTFRDRPSHATTDLATWVDGLGRGVLAVKAYGMCQPGDGTMLDALVPAVQGMSISLRESKNPVYLLSRAVRQTKAAVEPSTEKPHVRTCFRPDAGAVGVLIVLEAVLEKFLERSAADGLSD